MSTLEALTGEVVTTTAEQKNDSASLVVTDTAVCSNVSSEKGTETIESVLAKYEYIEPSIYGFIHRGIEVLYRFKRSLKLGFTTRIAGTRLYEWSKKPGYGKDSNGREWISTEFTFVPKFVADNGKTIYFTDHAIHKALRKMGYLNTFETITEDERMKLRDTIDAGFILSTEFYTATGDLPDLTRDVVQDIIDSVLKPAYENKTGEYSFFEESISGQKAEISWSPTKDFEPRGYQNRAVLELYLFAQKVAHSALPNKDIMLWAPARSGKTMMAGWFLDKYAYDYENFPKEQKLIVIASAMADVYWEWKETFESHHDLGGKSDIEGHEKKFHFLGKNDLLSSNSAIDTAFKTADHVVVFLTLQDLSGSLRDGTKPAHEQLFDDSTGEHLSRVDYLIADECHHAVMSDVYGATIDNAKEVTDVLDEVDTETDEGIEKAREVLEEAEKEFSSLSPKDGRLLVSATPLEILFSKGSKFSVGKNVAVVTPDDIKADRDKWYEDNVINGNEAEYLSPYFGMIENDLSFAVNVGDPSKIFAPNEKGNGFADHGTAVNAIKGIFAGFSGEGNKVPGFFVDDAFLNTGCGKNILITLPRRLSCDIFETVLKDVLEESGQSDDYDIFNISGETSELAKSNAQEIKSAIDGSEKKTVTLTVNKMTTGVSVKKWDTVVVMTSGESIQHQIQIMGRVNTPWVQTVKEDGEIRKIAKKQTTAVIHFSPSTLYMVRENTDALYRRAMKKSATSGGKHRDLVGGKIFEVSESGNLRPMSAVDVRKILQQKLRETGLKRIAESMDVDYSAVDASRLSGVRSSFDSDKKSGNTNVGLFDAPEGSQRCMTCRVNDQEIGSICFTCERKRAAEAAKKADKKKGNNTENEGLFFTDPETGINITVAEALSKEEKEEEKRQAEKSRIIRGLITSVLIYSVVTYAGERSLEEIEQTLISGINEDSILAASVLGLGNKSVSIVKDAVWNHSELDYSISSVRDMMEDEETLEDGYSKFEKLTVAMRGMNELSANEILTTREVASLVIDALGFSDDDWLKALMSDNKGFIDLGAKTGVFIVEVRNRVMAAIENNVNIVGNVVIDDVEFTKSELVAELKNSLYVVPTSPSAFVIIQRVFADYGFNADNIIGTNVFRSGGNTVSNFAHHLSMLLNVHFDGKVAGGKKKQESATDIKEKAFGNKDEYASALATADRKDFEEHFDGIATIEGVDEGTVWGLVRVLIEKKFDAAVGNPPYQEENTKRDGSDTTASNIFHHFYSASVKVSKSVSMVFPGGRWMQRSQGLNEAADNIFSTATTIDWYPNGDERGISKLFEGIRIPDGISIVSSHAEKSDFFINGVKSKRPSNRGIVPLQREYTSIVEKVSRLGGVKLNLRKSSVNLFGVRSFWTERYPETVSPVENGDPFKKSVKAWLGDGTPGKSKRVKEYYLDWNSVDWNQSRVDMMTKWKVTGSQGYVSKSPSIATYRVIDNEHLLGETWMIFGFFDTREEAENYHRYITSKLGKVLLESSKGSKLGGWGSFVPDLIDYTDRNFLFASDDQLPDDHSYAGSSLDERLYDHFGLSSDEIAIIENNSIKD